MEAVGREWRGEELGKRQERRYDATSRRELEDGAATDMSGVERWERRLTASDLEEVVVADAHNLLPPGKKSSVRSGEKETGVELAC